MDLDFRKLIAVGAIAGVLGFGGAAIAGAQEATDESTTTTEAPAAADEAPATTDDTLADREGCDKDGDGVPDDQQSEATSS